MIETEAKLKRWGRSFGVIIPMEKIKESNFSENETVQIVMTKKRNPLKKHFGTFKFKKSTQEMLDESDAEAWDE